MQCFQYILLAFACCACSIDAAAQLGLARRPLQDSTAGRKGLSFAKTDPSFPGFNATRLPQAAALRADLSTCQLPFFCRQELKLEQQTGIPFRLRVGSVQQSDWLEQKPGLLPPP